MVDVVQLRICLNYARSTRLGYDSHAVCAPPSPYDASALKRIMFTYSCTLLIDIVLGWQPHDV